MSSSPFIFYFAPLIPILIILLLISFFRSRSIEYPYTRMFLENSRSSPAGYVLRRVLKLAVLAALSAVLLFEASGYSFADAQPDRLCAYPDCSGFSSSQKGLNEELKRCMEKRGLKKAELFISGTRFEYPVSAEENIEGKPKKGQDAAAEAEKYFKDALLTGGYPVLFSSSGLEAYSLSAERESCGLLLGSIAVKCFVDRVEIISNKDTTCAYLLYDSAGRVSKSGTLNISEGMNIVQSGGVLLSAALIGGELAECAENDSRKTEVESEIESEFLSYALKALGYDSGEGIKLGYSSGDIVFARPKSRTYARSEYVVPIDSRFSEAMRDSFEALFYSSPEPVEGRVLVRSSLNEPLVAERDGKIFFAFSPDTFNSNIPLHGEFLSMIDVSVKIASGFREKPGKDDDVSYAELQDAPQRSLNFFERGKKLPLITIILALLYVIL